MFISCNFFGHVKDQGVYFWQQQGWDRLLKWLRVKERSKMGIAFTNNVNVNNLKSKLLKQHSAPFCSSSGGIFYFVGCHLVACWMPFPSKKD